MANLSMEWGYTVTPRLSKGGRFGAVQTRSRKNLANVRKMITDALLSIELSIASHLVRERKRAYPF